jgi:hypothetical protein
VLAGAGGVSSGFVAGRQWAATPTAVSQRTTCGTPSQSSIRECRFATPRASGTRPGACGSLDPHGSSKHAALPLSRPSRRLHRPPHLFPVGREAGETAVTPALWPRRSATGRARDTWFGTPGVTPTDAAAAAPLPRRGSTLAWPTGWSAPPLARFTPAASRRAAVSAPATRLPVVVHCRSVRLARGTDGYERVPGALM